MRSKANEHAQATLLITQVRQLVHTSAPQGHPDRAWVDQCAASIFLRAGNLPAARPLAEAAYRANALDGAAVLTYAEVLRRAGDFNGAFAACRALAQHSSEPDPTLIETMADIMRDAGQLEAALQAYEQATQLVVAQGGPDHFNLLTLLEGHALALRRLGREPNALALDQRRAEIEAIVRR
jgi:tetratricopeptide (TPR) repeat protein